jgi:hypothetical protein
MVLKREFSSPMHPDISLWLDSYDDIFSDFDSRDASVRAISVDFLDEAKRAAADKNEGLKLNLLIRESKRDKRIERIIGRRLKSHFERHHRILKKEKNSMIKNGFLFVFTGVLIMALAAYVMVNFEEKTTLTSFLLILLEPAGWFFFWEGLDIVLFKPKEKKEEFNFYKKLSHAEINFDSY